MFNTQGEVVGINTAIVAGGTGIGFAIPVNLAKQLLPELHSKGRVSRGWLGVTIQKITPELARSFNLSHPQGALVAEVMPNSPAARGGLRQGDVITAFDGTEIRDMHELPRVVAKTPVGKEIQVEILRQGKTKTLAVKVSELKDDTPLSSSEVTLQLGMKVEELTPELAQNMGVHLKEGIVVVDVDANGAAAEAGMRRGDVILEVNRWPVRDVRDYSKALERTADATVLLLISRGETTLYIALKK